MEINELISKAKQTYSQNWPATTCFERAIFCSWSCAIGDCTFCFMSTQSKDELGEKRRTAASILAEVLLCKKYKWEIGFVTGGMHAWKHEELLELFKKIYEIYEDKFWISFGPLSREQVEAYKPYAKGVVGSTETINPELHKKVCPSKPLEPYEKMFEYAAGHNLKKAMTFIVGIGEKHEDFELMKNFIAKYKIDKIHIYGLNPQKGTVFENSEPPTKEEQAWWIAKTRLEFPKIDIQMGIWLDRVDRISYLLEAGTNSISKFPITSSFGKETAIEIEKQAEIAGRKFKGTLTRIKAVDWKKELDKTSIDDELKGNILEKVLQYEKKMKRNVKTIGNESVDTEKIITLLKDYTKHNCIKLTNSGNLAIFTAFFAAKQKGISEVLIPDQGGWLTYKTYPTIFGMKVTELKTNYGILDLEELKKHKNKALIFTSFAGYFAEQPRDEIIKICKENNIYLIEDASARLTKCNGEADIILGSFGKWKLVDNHHGGFISFKNPEDYPDGIKCLTRPVNLDYSKLLSHLEKAPERLVKLMQKCDKIKKDLSNHEVIYPDKQGIVVVVKYKTDEELQQLKDYCKNNNLQFTICPRYIRVETQAISIEVKRK